MDAVGPAPVEDGVEVVLEDPVLRPLAVEPDGETGLDRLPLERDLVPDVEVADELLRERRAALDDLAGADVLRERPRDPLEVDPAVLVEAAVLDRDRGQPHPLADPVQLARAGGSSPPGSSRAASRRPRRRTSSGRSPPGGGGRGRSAGAIAAAPVIPAAPIAATTSTRAATSRASLRRCRVLARRRWRRERRR